MEKKIYTKKVINGVTVFYDKTTDMIFTDKAIHPVTDVSLIYNRTLGVKDIPYDTIIEVTTFCNQMCENCFAKCGEVNGKELDFAFLENAISEREQERVRIAITGGEPFLYSRIEDLLNLPRKYNTLSFVINTNGNFILTAALEKALIDNNWLVSFSIHGTEKAHNQYTRTCSFKNVLRTLQQLNDKLIIHVYCVFNRFMSTDDIDFLLSLRKKYSIQFFRFIIPRKFGRYSENYNKDLLIYLKSKVGNDTYAGIKSSSSPSELINVTGKSRDAS